MFVVVSGKIVGNILPLDPGFITRDVLKSKQKQWRRHDTGNKSHKSEAISNQEISSMLNRRIYIVQSNWSQHTEQHFTNSFAILFTLARDDVLNIVPCVVVTLIWRRVKMAKKIQNDKVKLGPMKTVEMSVQWNLKFDPTLKFQKCPKYMQKSAPLITLAPLILTI